MICKTDRVGIPGAICWGTSAAMVELTQEVDCVEMNHRLEYQWVRDAYALQACDAETVSFSPTPKSVTEMRFHVDAEEQHIRIDVTYDCKVIRFEESELFAVLLRLARKRLEDTKANKSPQSEQGWLYTADFLDKLHLEEEALNLAICRLRKLFQRRGIENAWNIVERRRKQLRIGIRQLKVIEAAKPLEVKQ